jgi:acetolactate synthase-1/2/3 large subunit
LEVVTDKKVPVLPMVPGGSALHEFLVYDEGSSPPCYFAQVQTTNT